MDKTTLFTVIGIIIAFGGLIVAIMQYNKKEDPTTSVTSSGEGDAVNGDKAGRDYYKGDKVGGDKYGGDKVQGKKVIHNHYNEKK